MAYCKNCGHQLKEGASFCGECGQVVAKPSQPSQPTYQQPANPVPTSETRTGAARPPKKPMSKKAKILTGVAVTFAILLIGSYYFINHMFGPASVADGFMDAIAEKDVQKVKNYITEGQMVLSLDDKQVESFIKYLHEDPRTLTDISKRFSKDMAQYEATKTISVMGVEDDSSIAQLKYNGKKWLIFDQYVVQIDPVYVKVSSTEDQTDIMIGNEKAGTISKKKGDSFGPFLPGVYEIKAVVNGDYGKVEQVEEVNFSEVDSSEMDLEFSWSDYYVKLDSWSDDDAVVYVNGKSTNKTIDELEVLGPIQKNGSIKVYAQKGKQKSKEFVVDEKTSSLDFDIKEIESASSSAVVPEKGAEASATNSVEEEQNIENAIVSHYSGISDKNYSGAYDYFSSARKSKVTLAGWEKGLKNTMKDEVTTVDIKSVDGNTAKAYIKMTSYDDQGDGTVLVQEWGGNWNLVKENGSWKLNDPELEKLDSRVE